MEPFVGHSPWTVVIILAVVVGCSPQSETVFTKAPLTDLGETRRFVGHEEPVTCLAISPDGKRLLSGCGRPEIVNGKPMKVLDTSIRLWDIESGEQIRKFEGHGAVVESVAFSPDANVAASGGDDGIIRIWDLETGLEKRAITGHNSPIFCVGFFSDGERLYSGGVDGTVRIWNFDTGAEIRHFGPMTRLIRAVSLSADETEIVAGGTAAEVYHWQIANGAELPGFKSRGAVQSLAFSPDGKTFLVTSAHNPIVLIDSQDGTMIREFDGHRAYEIYCSGFTPNGKRFASCGGDQKLLVWDAATSREVMRIDGFCDGLNCVVLSPDGAKVIAAGGGRHPASLDYTIRLWSLPD
jgi:WD40 repeat protein